MACSLTREVRSFSSERMSPYSQVGFWRPQRKGTDVSASAAERTSPVGSGGWVLGACMGLSNVLGYAFVLIVSRSLGPADFGAFSAVNNTAMFLSLPASAFQVVVAAHQARGHAHRSGIGLALLVGGGLALLTAVLSPVIAAMFHLGSPVAVLLVALMMPAYTLTGAAQGLLLGHRRLPALASVYLAISGARVLSALVAAALGAGVVGVFAWLLIAAWAPALMSLWLARRHVQRWRRFELGLVQELLTSNGTLAVLLAMTSTDVLLARHLLTAHDAGAYAFAGLFGKVVFWGTQFVALTLVPVASRSGGRRPVMGALGLVLGMGLLGSAVVAAVPEQLVRLLGGTEYLDAAGLLLAFTGLGTLWALCQVLLFAEMARGHRSLTVIALLATAAGALVVLVTDTRTAGAIVATYAAVALVVAIIGSARFLLSRGEPGAVTAAAPTGSAVP